jgi:predicted transcriptional regulator
MASPRNFNLELGIIASTLKAVASLEVARTESIAEVSGINIQKAKGMLGWLLSAKLIISSTTGYKLTPIGKAVFEGDPNVGRNDTLWVLYYGLSSNPDFPVWYILANRFLPSRNEFSHNEALQFLLECCLTKKTRDSHIVLRDSLDQHLKSDLSLFLRAMTRENSMGSLRYLLIVGDGRDRVDLCRYRRIPNPEIDPLIVALVLYQERNRCRPGASTWNVPDLLASEGNVGRVFGLKEERFLRYVGQLQERRLLTFTRHANLYQIGFPWQGNTIELLEMYYKENSP